MKINSKFNKRIVIASILIVSLIALIPVSIYIYWNNLEFSQKYKFQLQKARNLLEDEYSKEVFDYAVDVTNLYPDYSLTPRHKIRHNELKNIYPELEHPKVPVNNGDTFIDGGIGIVTKQISIEEKLARMFDDNIRIIGFEPDTDKISSIKKQLIKSGSKNVEIYPVGLWKSNTTKKMQRYEWGNMNSVKSSIINYAHSKKADSISVKLVKLDDFVKEHDIKRLDYIRLNIEGSELEALIGAKNTIKTLKPNLCIRLEHYPKDLFSIIFYLNSLKLGYKFYLGIHDFPIGFTLYASAR